MPTIDTNKNIWDGEYEWTNRGDEWSAAWGGPAMQWYGAILPRIQRNVPAENVLEIACGFGRWTNFLKDLCDHLVVVDLSQECIEACQKRFKDSTNIEYQLNDGKSLDTISDDSIDFMFSYDSLVHADTGVLDAYLSQLGRILRNNGAAFIHHSNFGEYYPRLSGIRRFRRLEMMFEKLNLVEPSHMRDPQVTAEIVAQLARDNDLLCISQEIVPWGTKRMHLDCFSTIVKKESPHARENRIYRNGQFMKEARNLSRLSQLYTPDINKS